MEFSIVFPKELVYFTPSLFLKNVLFLIIVESGPKLYDPMSLSNEIQLIIVSTPNIPER